MNKSLSYILFPVFAVVFGCSMQRASKFPIHEQPIILQSKSYIDNTPFVGDGRFYWGSLSIIPLQNQQSKIVSSDQTQPFEPEMEGMIFVSARIHKNPTDFPIGNENYWPAMQTCRYSKVIQVLNDSTLLVDFQYNGGNIAQPQAIHHTDGYFFTDNRIAFKTWIEDPNRPELIELKDDHIYVLKGLPGAELKKSLTIRRSGDGKKKPIVLLSLEDAFPLDESGNTLSKSYPIQFGAYSFFELFPNDANCIIEDVDICPPIYTVSNAAGGGLTFFWRDKNRESSQSRICRISNSNMYRVKSMVIAYLGTERVGMNWDLPVLAYCLDGGIGTDDYVTDFSVFELANTSWSASTVLNTKGKERSGILFKAKGDVNAPIELMENASVKTTSSGTISFEMQREGNHTLVKVHSSDFTWYQLANQYWTGGTSTSSSQFNRLNMAHEGDSFQFHFHNNADFRALYGERTFVGGIVNGQVARIFDAVPVVGELIDWRDSTQTGILRKVNSQTIDVWGYQFAIGDKLSYESVSYKVVQIIPMVDDGTFSKYSIHFWRLTLDGPPIIDERPNFEVLSSKLGSLIRERDLSGIAFIDRDPLGHLFYIDGGVNLDLENVKTYGYWRSSGSGVGKPTKRSQVASIARFKNVTSFGTGGVGAQWSPPFFNFRMREKGDAFVLENNGSNLLVFQTPQSDFTMKVFNRPTARGQWVSPINGDSLGLTADTVSKLFSLTLNEGDDFSIKDLKGSMVLIHAFGRCTLRVDGYEGYYPNPTHPTTSNRMHGLTIVKADQSTQLYIIGKGGRGPIRCISNAIQSSKQLVIDLRNWVPEPEFYNGKFITLPFTPETDSMYYQKIRAIGRNSENLLTPTN